MCFPIVAVYISYETVIAAKAFETKSPRAGLGNGPSWAKPGKPRERVRNAPPPSLITYVILIYIIFESSERKPLFDIGSGIIAMPFSALATPQLFTKAAGDYSTCC